MVPDEEFTQNTKKLLEEVRKNTCFDINTGRCYMTQKDIELLAELLKHNTSARSIFLEFSLSFPEPDAFDKALQVIFAALKKHTSVKFLITTFSNFLIESLSELITENKSLFHLIFIGVRDIIPPENVNLLKSGFANNNTLQKLTCCGFDRNWLPFFIESIKRCESIRYLRLSPGKRCNSSDLKLIFETIRTHKSLCKLELIEFFEDPLIEVAIEIAKELAKDCKLTELTLYDDFNDEDCMTILKSLESNKSIQKFQLITRKKPIVESARSIAEMLGKNTTLQYLSLFENRYKDADIVTIAEGLKKNTTLRSISINFAERPRLGLKALAEMLESNFTLKSIKLGVMKYKKHVKNLEHVPVLFDITAGNVVIPPPPTPEEAANEKAILRVICARLDRNREQQTRDIMQAFLMGFHPRLGANSAIFKCLGAAGSSAQIKETGEIEKLHAEKSSLFDFNLLPDIFSFVFKLDDHLVKRSRFTLLSGLIPRLAQNSPMKVLAENEYPPKFSVETGSPLSASALSVETDSSSSSLTPSSDPSASLPIASTKPPKIAPVFSYIFGFTGSSVLDHKLQLPDWEYFINKVSPEEEQQKEQEAILESARRWESSLPHTSSKAKGKSSTTESENPNLDSSRSSRKFY